MRPHSRYLSNEFSNLNDLSSICEHTEEELCTPDRDFNNHHSVINTFGRHFSHLANTYRTNMSQIKTIETPQSFYERIDMDIKERNIRQYEFKQMFSHPQIHANALRKASAKKVKEVVCQFS